MIDELRALFFDARDGELTPTELGERLETIQRRHGDADSPEVRKQRREAVAAYHDFTLTIERHHALERLARALGLGDDPEALDPVD